MHSDRAGIRPVRFTPARIAAVLALAVLLCSAALAQAQDGELLLERGAVTVRHGRDVKIHKDAGSRVPLFAGDDIRTGLDSAAVITFKASQDSVNLYEQTFFHIETLGARAPRFALMIGKAYFRALALAGVQRRFEVTTPTAVLGVKGTEFVVGTDGDDTFLLTVSGLVAMIGHAFLEREAIAGLDHVAAVRRGEPPTPPVPVTPQVREQIVKEPGLGGFLNLDLRTGKGKEERKPDPVAAVTGTQETVRNLNIAKRTGSIGWDFCFGSGC